MAKATGKIPWSNHGSYLVRRKTTPFDSLRFYLYYGASSPFIVHESTGKNPVVIPGSYLVKTRTSSFDSSWFCLPYGAFVNVRSSFVTPLWL